jgi:hypothetical protein
VNETYASEIKKITDENDKLIASYNAAWAAKAGVNNYTAGIGDDKTNAGDKPKDSGSGSGSNSGSGSGSGSGAKTAA